MVFKKAINGRFMVFKKTIYGGYMVNRKRKLEENGTKKLTGKTFVWKQYKANKGNQPRQKPWIEAAKNL